MRPISTELHVQRLERPHWNCDSPINQEIAALVAPSYLDSATLLEREFAHCDLLYYLRDEDGQLVCFLMVARETVSVAGCERPAVFLGLSATSQATKGSGLIWRVYRTFVDEARGWQRILACPLLLWATTATPSAYHAVNRLFDDLQPRPDGTYALDALQIANALRARYGRAPAAPGDHPFVMHAVANHTRYSPCEEARIAALRQAHGFDLFDRLAVDQRNGDRTLLVCRLRDVAGAGR